jgi:two-component system sensor histidine kinase CreC
MKSPLAAIRGAAELLQEPMPDEQRQRFAHSILSQQQRLTETIDKLLVLAEVEQHGWLQKRQPVAVDALLAQVVEDAASQARSAEVELIASAEDPGLVVQGDAFLLRQALGNLVDNALAFSPANGRVQVIAQQQGDLLRLCVRDQGPGIPDYARERVFERFYSLARPATGHRSSGLGLPFVREVARLHGGEISLESRAEGGTEAVLTVALG